MRGWTINPDRGPATKTRDMSDLERPSSSRYGDAKAISMDQTHCKVSGGCEFGFGFGFGRQEEETIIWWTGEHESKRQGQHMALI